MNELRNKLLRYLRPLILPQAYPDRMTTLQHNLHNLAQWSITLGLVMACLLFLTNPHPSKIYLSLGGASFLLILWGLVTSNTVISRVLSAVDRVDQELDVARQIQLKLLPAHIPQSPFFDIAAFYYPAQEVGGDFFDFLPLNDHQLAVVIGDVSGKGISAALHMAQIRGMLGVTASVYPDPKHFLNVIHNALCASLDKNRFVTLLYGILDFQAGTFSFMRAGHEGLIYVSQSEGTVKTSDVLRPPGMCLSAVNRDVFDSALEEWSFEIHGGDVLVFYTDGVSEAMNPLKEGFGEDRILEVVTQHAQRSAAGIANALLDALHDFVGTAAQHDDTTLIVIKFKEMSELAADK